MPNMSLPRHRTAAAALALFAALPAAAQSPLVEPAPGLAPPRAEGGPRALVDPRPAPGAESGFAGPTNRSATDIIRSLAPFADGNPGAPAGVRTVDPAGGAPVRVDFARSIDLTVFFAYDSDRLTPEAYAQLDQLALALAAPELAPHRFLIAGHTDARGPAAYNLDLSARRALAVARYLVSVHGIALGRLVPHGFGEGRLAAPSLPESGANRRVEVALIVPERAALPGADGRVLADPRRALHPHALDDFAGAPTPVAN